MSVLMKVFREFDKITDEIKNEISSKSVIIISIDGKDGSGKSTFAENISKQLNAVHIDLDEDKYLIKNKSTYVDFIKYSVLEDELDSLKKMEAIIVIEEICILKILDRLKIESGLKIYVKKLTRFGYWFEGQDFDYSRSADDIINEGEESLKKFIEISSHIEGVPKKDYQYQESIHHEIIRYHHEYQPDLNTDFVFEWLQSNG